MTTNKYQTQAKIFGVLSIIFFIFSLFLIVNLFSNKLSSEFYEIEQENKVLKEILYVDSLFADASIPTQRADRHYDEAGFFYEEGDWKGTESSCRIARDYYSEASQGYRDISAHLKKVEVEDVLIDLYIQSADILAEIRLNMFEACEHFESASRYYDLYYQSTSWYDPNYEMGSAEIENMNKFIREHDKNVRIYNDILSEIKVELKRRLENEQRKE
jgi:hypothetical protein